MARYLFFLAGGIALGLVIGVGVAEIQNHQHSSTAATTIDELATKHARQSDRVGELERDNDRLLRQIEDFQSAAEKPRPESLEGFEFAGYRWTPDKAIPLSGRYLNGDWAYSSEGTTARLVERREWKGAPAGWQDYAIFCRGRLIFRYMEIANPRTGEWVMHGPEVKYHIDSSMGYGVWWMGEVSRSLNVTLAQPDFLWDDKWQLPGKPATDHEQLAETEPLSAPPSEVKTGSLADVERRQVHYDGPRFRHNDSLVQKWSSTRRLWEVQGEVENLTGIHWKIAVMEIAIVASDGIPIGSSSLMVVDWPSGEKRKVKISFSPYNPSERRPDDRTSVELWFHPEQSTLAPQPPAERE